MSQSDSHGNSLWTSPRQSCRAVAAGRHWRGWGAGDARGRGGDATRLPCPLCDFLCPRFAV